MKVYLLWEDDYADITELLKEFMEDREFTLVEAAEMARKVAKAKHVIFAENEEDFFDQLEGELHGKKTG